MRLKKSNLKINATLSALFNSLGLNPVKTLSDLTQVAQSATEAKFFVDLRILEDGSYDLLLKQNPDSFYLKNLMKKGAVSETQLKDYAKSTLGKSLATTVDARVQQLKGILKSFN